MKERARTRRTAEDAQRTILEAAEELLIASGPLAVTMRAVAERVGMTDAGVHHHFGSRDGLLEALLKHGGRRLRGEWKVVMERWLDEGVHIEPLVVAVANFYRRGYGQLAIALHHAGWRGREHGRGMLEPVVAALHAARRGRGRSLDLNETRLAVAAMHQALAVEPSYGAAFRRSTGFTGEHATDPSASVAWWVTTLATMLELPA